MSWSTHRGTASAKGAQEIAFPAMVGAALDAHFCALEECTAMVSSWHKPGSRQAGHTAELLNSRQFLGELVRKLDEVLGQGTQRPISQRHDPDWPWMRWKFDGQQPEPQMLRIMQH
jgi:hypothetical protein